MSRAIKFCVAIVSIVIFISCATQKWTNVSNSINVDSLLQQKFPVLYDQYKSNKIIIDKVEQRTAEAER